MMCSKCGKQEQLRRSLCKACYATRRDRDIASGRWTRQHTDAEPARAHTLALLAAGMSRREICAAAGVGRSRLRVLLRTENPPAYVWPATAAAFLSVPIPNHPADVAADHDLVNAIGTQRRLRALVAFGWPQSHLAARLEMTPANFGTLIHHQDRVTAVRHRAVVALFDRLQMQPGPSSRASAYGLRRKWALPFQWDDDTIDQPDTGIVVRRRPRSRAAG